MRHLSFSTTVLDVKYISPRNLFYYHLLITDPGDKLNDNIEVGVGECRLPEFTVCVDFRFMAPLIWCCLGCVTGSTTLTNLSL